MTLLSSIQGKIETKIFNRLGSTVTRTPYVSQTVDKWGDASITTDTNENITAVPYSYLEKREDFQMFGDLQRGEVVMAFKQDQTLSERDTITFDSSRRVNSDTIDALLNQPSQNRTTNVDTSHGD